MALRDKILVVGGYGLVGRAIVRSLAPQLPGRLVVAGRSLEKAEALAKEAGHGARGVALDISRGCLPSDLADCMEVVVTCLDQQDTAFMRSCIESGADYVDVSAHRSFLEAAEGLDPLAAARGRTAVLSVGLAPGLTNLLAAHLVAQFQAVDRLDVFVMLGSGDAHGDAAIAWTLDNLDAEFVVRERGRARRVTSLRESSAVEMLGGARRAYRFGFPDQVTLARTLRIPTVSTWLCFDSRLVTWLLAGAARLGLGRLARSRLGRAALTYLLGRFRLGSDVCALTVRAEGTLLERPTVREARLVGRREADVTGWVAAEVVRALVAGRSAPGVHHIDEILTPTGVLSALEAAHPDLEVVL